MPENIDTRNHPAVKALITHQERIEETDAVFARRYIMCSASSWSLIKSGQYTADPTKMLDRCETALRMLNDQSERSESTNTAKGKIIDFPHVKATIAAVKKCYDEPQNRLVFVLAPSGGGKTTIARRLSEQYRGASVAIEATESWRGSYFYALAAVAEAIGIPEASIDPRRLENAVFDELTRSPRILVIDEGHYLGPAALNLQKAILNKTDARIVLLAIPKLWEDMAKKAYEEVLQLRRRAVAKIVVVEISTSDCRKFLAEKLPGYDGLNGDEKAVVEKCCETANRFGLFDTLERICTEVREENGNNPKSLALDDVKAAIKRVEALRS